MDPKRILCDAMLNDLARWLRAAGYDTEIVTNEKNDREIFIRALKESRWLLTCDKEYTQRKESSHYVILLKQGSLNDKVHQLNQKLSLDWLNDPFSRCLECNLELRDIEKESLPETIPLGIRERFQEFKICPGCQHIYWDGGHTKRMRERLEAFQSA